MKREEQGLVSKEERCVKNYDFQTQPYTFPIGIQYYLGVV